MEIKGYYNQEPFDEGYITVDEVNQIYYARFGNPNGTPVIFCHGGPGGGTSNACADFFDPNFYHTIIFDQRGCGKSKPLLSTFQNTIYHLVEDVELIRKHFFLEKVIVFGGSFGSTLALAYAIKYPSNVSKLVLRGIFLGRQSDVFWLYEFGASEFFPEEHEKLKKLARNKNIIREYYKLFRNTQTRDAALKRFANFEANIASINYNPIISTILEPHEEQIAFLENLYFFHKTFKKDNYILDNCYKIKNIPTYIVHGRYDMICRPSSAYALANNLKNVKLHFVQAGHSSRDEKIFSTLVSIMDEIKKQLDNNLN